MQLFMKEVLKKNGIELVFSELEKNGYYSYEFKTMFVNQALSEERQKEVILHELGHYLTQSDYFLLYSNPIFNMKMESEANHYMIKSLIEGCGGQFNYTNVMDKFHLGLGWEGKL